MTSTNNYHYIVVAYQFVKAGGVGLTLVVRTTLLVGMIEDVEVVVIRIVAVKGIGNEFQSDDFPTPVSPTRRTVYGTLAGSFVS